eukprot:3015760-Rhodomonas_salina.1
MYGGVAAIYADDADIYAGADSVNADSASTYADAAAIYATLSAKIQALYYQKRLPLCLHAMLFSLSAACVHAYLATLCAVCVASVFAGTAAIYVESAAFYGGEVTCLTRAGGQDRVTDHRVQKSVFGPGKRAVSSDGCDGRLESQVEQMLATGGPQLEELMEVNSSLRNQMRSPARTVQFVPEMRLCVFDFAERMLLGDARRYGERTQRTASHCSTEREIAYARTAHRVASPMAVLHFAEHSRCPAVLPSTPRNPTQESAFLPMSVQFAWLAAEPPGGQHRSSCSKRGSARSTIRLASTTSAIGLRLGALSASLTVTQAWSSESAHAAALRLLDASSCEHASPMVGHHDRLRFMTLARLRVRLRA